jgi:hypothetical protein
MGEYALLDGREQIKIGTCENMYYLRIEDVHRVRKDVYSLNAQTEPDLRFRLPYPDEDSLEPGSYGDYSRTYPLHGYSPEWLDEADVGGYQLRHESGLLLNVPCHHGRKLPEVGPGMSAHWNGKGHFLELAFVKRTASGEVLPIVRCRACGDMWRDSWENVLPFILDETLRDRLAKHAQEVETDDPLRLVGERY